MALSSMKSIPNTSWSSVKSATGSSAFTTVPSAGACFRAACGTWKRRSRSTKMPRLAQSAELVPHSRIRELAEIAMSMDGVLRLYFGESNLPTPEYIKQAAIKALADGYTFYTENAGLPSLRRAIAEHYLRLHSVNVDPAREIVITASGVQALNLAIRCLLDPGDEALVLSPVWPNGCSSVAMANAVTRQIPHPLCGGRYVVDFDALEAALNPRTRLLLYTSPSNPLGWVATEREQEQLLEFARRHGLWLLADEVYDRLYYAGSRLGCPVPSILRKASREDAVAVVQSFSKSYCMTGWRVGWLVARRDLAAKATQLNEFIVSHAPSFAQKAAETALAQGEPDLLAMLERLKHNRDLCLAALNTMRGVTVPEPDGAFYLFPRIAGAADSFGFCKRLLEQRRVGLAPGVAFGPGGEGSVRICYAAEQNILEPALERLAQFLQSET
ncbi:MAG: aspartate aminotransferase [Terriglobia bacterium]|nr:MAG: aspartate aminotransferase [Terriglobia bacterium]